jgi:hypothetical protein
MRLDASPPLGDDELDAIADAIARAGVLLDGRTGAYESAWRRTALEEAVDAAQPESEDGYALSPRSTRGATRA